MPYEGFASFAISKNGKKVSSKHGAGKFMFLLWPVGFNEPVKIIENDKRAALRKLLKWCFDSDLNKRDFTVKSIKGKLFSNGPPFVTWKGPIYNQARDVCKYYVEVGLLSRAEVLDLVNEVEAKK